MFDPDPADYIVFSRKGLRGALIEGDAASARDWFEVLEDFGESDENLDFDRALIDALESGVDISELLAESNEEAARDLEVAIFRKLLGLGEYDSGEQQSDPVAVTPSKNREAYFDSEVAAFLRLIGEIRDLPEINCDAGCHGRLRRLNGEYERLLIHSGTGAIIEFMDELA